MPDQRGKEEGQIQDFFKEGVVVRYYIKDKEYSATMIVVCLFLYLPIQSNRLA